jgi:hypothetical protein
MCELRIYLSSHQKETIKQREGLVVLAEKRRQSTVDHPWSNHGHRRAKIPSSPHKLQDIRMLHPLPNPKLFPKTANLGKLNQPCQLHTIRYYLCTDELWSGCFDGNLWGAGYISNMWKKTVTFVRTSMSPSGPWYIHW